MKQIKSLISGVLLASLILIPANTSAAVDPVCANGQEGYAATVTESSQGEYNGGGQIVDINRSEPVNVLGTPDSKFFSLGKNGYVVVKFEGHVKDVAGDDITVRESTNGRNSYPEESAKVEVSEDGVSWKTVGTVSGKISNGIAGFNVSATGFSAIKFVKITDVTNWALHTPGADGFDLESIAVKSQVCNSNSTPSISGTVFRDLNGNTALDGTEGGMPGWKVFIDSNNNGSWEAIEPQNTTDSDGKFSFSNLNPGTYTLREEIQNGYSQTVPSAADDGKIVVTLTNSPITNLLFGNQTLGGGGSGGSGGGSSPSPSPTPTPSSAGGPTPQVLGVTTPDIGNIGSGTSTTQTPLEGLKMPAEIPTTPQVLGASTELPRTGTSNNVLILILGLSAIVGLIAPLKKPNLA